MRRRATTGGGDSEGRPATCRGQGDPFRGSQAGQRRDRKTAVTPQTSPGGSGTFRPRVLGQEAGPGFLRARGASSACSQLMEMPEMGVQGRAAASPKHTGGS